SGRTSRCSSTCFVRARSPQSWPSVYRSLKRAARTRCSRARPRQESSYSCHSGRVLTVDRVMAGGVRAKPGLRYPPIAEHGLIGDLHTVALVGTDGTIDWYCCPRFDSPSVFASILDADRGGMFRIAPDGEGWSSKQLYLPDTNVLITRFLTPEGVGEVQDFMPPPRSGITQHRHRMIRR